MFGLETIADLLHSSDDIAVITHVNPDGDALGSAFALKHALTLLGKKAEVVLDAPIGGPLAVFDWGGVVFCEDTALPKIAVSVDNSDVQRMGRCLSLFEKADIKVCIDHHITNTHFAQYNFVDAGSASTGEIIYKLIKLLGVPLDTSTATSLYIAVVTDSGGFRYSNTTPGTLRAAAEFMETGINSADICRKIYDNIHIDRLRLQGDAINHIELFAQGRVAALCIPRALMEKYNASEDDIDGFANLARSVQGVEVSALLKERENEVKVSFRSNEYVNVADIASKFGGGGHVRASGCTLNNELEEAKMIVVKAMTESL